MHVLTHTIFLCLLVFSFTKVISCLYIVRFRGVTLLLSMSSAVWVGNTQVIFHLLYLQLAKIYSYAHGWMHQGWNCGDYFPDGITNGASWYSLSKGKKSPGCNSAASWSGIGFISLSKLSFFSGKQQEYHRILHSSRDLRNGELLSWHLMSSCDSLKWR